MNKSNVRGASGSMSVDTDQNGMVLVAPLTGFGLRLFLEKAVCVLRVEFARTPEQLGGRREAIQLALTPDQALRLAQELTDTVAPAAGPPPGTFRN